MSDYFTHDPLRELIMNIDEYNKYFTHFCDINNAPPSWSVGRHAFIKAYSYYQEDWTKTLQLAQDFVEFTRE